MGYIALTGKVTPAKVAPSEPNIETKLMIIGNWGYIEKIRSETEHVAITKKMLIIINEMIVFVETILFISIILANMAIEENIIIYGNNFPKIILRNFPLPKERHSFIPFVLKSFPKE